MYSHSIRTYFLARLFRDLLLKLHHVHAIITIFSSAICSRYARFKVRSRIILDFQVSLSSLNWSVSSVVKSCVKLCSAATFVDIFKYIGSHTRASRRSSPIIPVEILRERADFWLVSSFGEILDRLFWRRALSKFEASSVDAELPTINILNSSSRYFPCDWPFVILNLRFEIRRPFWSIPAFALVFEIFHIELAYTSLEFKLMLERSYFVADLDLLTSMILSYWRLYNIDILISSSLIVMSVLEPC